MRARFRIAAFATAAVALAGCSKREEPPVARSCGDGLSRSEDHRAASSARSRVAPATHRSTPPGREAATARPSGLGPRRSRCGFRRLTLRGALPGGSRRIGGGPRRRREGARRDRRFSHRWTSSRGRRGSPRRRTTPGVPDRLRRRSRDSVRATSEIAGGTPPPASVIDFWTRVGRNADVTCYGCHATGQTLTVVGRSASGLALPGSKWVEPGVGCEGCHGPGGPHIDAARAGTPARDTVKMPRGAGSAVIDACAACHGFARRPAVPVRNVAGASLRRTGHDRRGARCSPSAVTRSSAKPFFADLRPATYQQEAVALSQSGCATEGRDDLRSLPRRALGGAGARRLRRRTEAIRSARRATASIVAPGPKHTLHANATPGGRCIDCHMAPILRGPAHARRARSFDGAARRRIGTGSRGVRRLPCEAGRGRGGRRGLEADAVGPAAKAAPCGRSGDRRGPDRRGDPSRAHRRRSRARLVPPLGRARQAGRDGVPGPASEEVRPPSAAPSPMPIPPCAARRRAFSAACGKPSDIDALQRATDDSGSVGRPRSGARHRPSRISHRRIALLQILKRPDLIADARAHYMAGHGSLVGQDMPRAELALRRALEINPMIVGAMNDLGLALIGQGRRTKRIASGRARWTSTRGFARRAATSRPRPSGSAPAK